MGSLFFDAILGQHQYLFRIADSRKSVCNDKGCTVFASFSNDSWTTRSLVIECGGCLIKDQDRRILF